MGWKRGDAPIVGIRVSKYASPMDIVKEVQAVIRTLPRMYVDDCNGKPIDNYYVGAALEYSCRIGANPWHNYPQQREVVETILAEAGVHVYVEGYVPPKTRDLFGQWGTDSYAGSFP